MITKAISEKITKATETLSGVNLRKMSYFPQHEHPMPSIHNLKEIVELLRRIIFPGYFGESSLRTENVSHYIGVNIDRVFHLLCEEIKRGICFDCRMQSVDKCRHCESEAPDLTAEFISRLPKIGEMLFADVKSAYDGDPAAKNMGEIIFCYPTIRVLTNYRVAHELLELGVPLIPRIIGEMAHSETGIDIHPGATIGESFTIDHGTGVVIGETCVIGKNVKLYQGVTLGAKSFPLDEEGNPIKGIPRHPIVEDGVVIYSGATILGRITVGANSVIGGNVWVTNNVPPNSKLMQKAPKDVPLINGAGI